MRILALIVVVLGAAACQPADSAERSAEITAKAPVQASASIGATAPAKAASLTMSAGDSCGGGAACGGSCGGSCGGACGASCGAEAGKAAVTWNTPKDAAWTELHVAGMHCGGCARRIERALAQVDGVLGVQVDLATASVKIATASGTDVRGLATPTIDGLGYQVQ